MNSDPSAVRTGWKAETKWRAYEEAAAALRAIDPGAPGADEAIRNALKKVPTIAENDAFADSLRKPGDTESWLQKLNYQNHHVDPKYVIKRLLEIKYAGYPDQFINAELDRLEKLCPGYLMHRLRHTGRDGPVEKTIHRILSSDPPEGEGLAPQNVAFRSREQILTALRNSYRRWGQPEVAEVAEAWLRSEGLIP